MIAVKDLLPSHFNEDQCFLRKPTEVGRFSLDGSRRFHHDRSQMCCFIQPRVQPGCKINLDLNDGYNTERFIKRDEDVKERLEHLLQWMLINKDRFTNGNTQITVGKPPIGEFPHFVMWRGHLTKLMCTPYDKRDGWIMAAQKMGNTIYISEVESEEAATKRRNRSAREDLMTYWGVRFEGYMTGPFPKPGTEPCQNKTKEETIVNTNEAFCSVVRSRLNERHSLVYGGEVDCCQPVKVVQPPDCYVELKTSRVFSSQRQQDNFYRYKALKWWAQSFLVGIPQITCGFRDDDGHVTEICDFQTLDLPRFADRLHNSWDSDTCLIFLDKLLEHIKVVFQKCQSHDHVCLFYYNAGSPHIQYQWSNSPTDKFMPQWYIDSILK